MSAWPDGPLREKMCGQDSTKYTWGD